MAYVGKRTGAHCGDDGRTRAKCLGNRFAIVIELCSVEPQLPRTACHKRPLGGTSGGVVAGFGQCAYIDRRLIGVAGLKDIDHGEASGAASVFANSATGIGQLRPCGVNLVDVGHGAGLPLRAWGRERKGVTGCDGSFKQLVLGSGLETG